MAELKTAHAPYNFVPFSGKVLVPYKNVEELPPHDVMDPALKTGEIHVTLEAKTPVFVSDGKQEGPDGKNNDLHFFRSCNGKFALPAATIRGMVRENMQILGYGLMRPGEDMDSHQIYFRAVASRNNKITGEVKDYYTGVLGIKTQKDKNNRPVTIPENIKTGYLCCESGEYRIYPTAGACLRVSRNHQDVAVFLTGDVKKDNARELPVQYQNAADKVTAIRRAGTSDKNGWKNGQLLYTGKPVGDKANPLYLFPEIDRDAAFITLSDEDRLSYEEDWENRKNSLGAYYDPSFWKLPKEGECKPVFYLQHGGHTYCGMSRFLRIGYEHPLSDGLPEQHRALAEETDIVLDYPRAILGFAGKEDAYRSRVSFGDFYAEDTAKEGKPVRMILGGPKPSYYPGYVAADKDGKAVHYNDDAFRLRGYKQYWLKDVEATAVPEGKEKVGVTLRPMPENTRFHGVIRYKNLNESELGLLLWSLRLDEGCFQSIGMGRPYGYGRMALTIDRLTEYSPEGLYDSLFPSVSEANTETIEGYIRCYDTQAASNFTTGSGKKKKPLDTLRKRPEIRDFLFMKRTICSGTEYSYMPLDDYKLISDPLPDVKKFREAAAAKAEEPAPSQGMDALREKWGPKYSQHTPPARNNIRKKWK